jgi:tripartite-type tricarboxylate transporter receptor subunit TctC
MKKIAHCFKRSTIGATFAALGLLTALAAAPVQAQDYPKRPIRIITPYDPGSVVDATTRIVAQGLSEKLGQPVIVENKSGGMGIIAMNALLNAPADGYVLLTDTPASAINPTLYKSRYNPKTDIVPIAQLMKLPFVIGVSPALKAKTAAELVAMAKKSPGEINVAVAGTSTGLVGELFSLQTGAKFQSVPYKGAGAATMALLKDEAQVIFLDSANLTPYINSGKLNGLLITGNERSPLLKDVPTAKEAGYASFDVSTWFGVFARAGLAQDVQTKLNAAVREVMVSPKVQEYLKARGATASNMTQSEFTTFFHKEVDTWADVIKKADIKAN